MGGSDATLTECPVARGGELADPLVNCNREIKPTLRFSINRSRIERLAGTNPLEFGRAVAGGRRDFAVKTRAAAGVAGTGADLLDQQNESVLIAVGANFDNPLGVAGSGTLVPEFLARARPVDSFANLQGAAQRFGIH